MNADVIVIGGGIAGLATARELLQAGASVTIIERELLNALERHGIRRMQPLNEPFNPHLHQAVMEIPRSNVASGTVVQVFQPGYMIEERVLRPAMVGVAKGGPKLPTVPEDGAPGSEVGEDSPS